MEKFIFDLQRFADVCSLNGVTYDSLAAAYANANDGDTITLFFASSGVLSVSASDLTSLDAGDELLIIDADDYTKSYGYLTKVNDNTFALTKDGNTSTLSGITINDNLTAQISADFRNVPIIVANSSGRTVAIFYVTASGYFTVDTTNYPATVDGATSITLTNGEIQAPLSVPVTVNGNQITAKSGAMNIGLNANGKVVVSALNMGDTFTVGNVSYEMTAAGLYDTTNRLIATSGVSEDRTTFTVDDAVFGNIISLDDNGNLDLTAQLSEYYSSYVFDSATNPTKVIATVTYDGTVCTLTATDDYGFEIQSVSLGSVKTFATDITTTVKTSKSGTYTINDNTFTARSALTIESDFSEATLTNGSVTLAAGNAVMLTMGKTIAATAGTITVTISGDTVTLGAIGSGDAFTVDGKTYTMTASGLSDGKSLRKIDTSITLAELNNEQDSGLILDNSSDAKVTVPSGVAVVDATARTKAIKITANKVANSIVGGAGKDTIAAGNGDDTVYGGAGNDSISGGNDNDYLSGDAGNDKLLGDAGNDTLAGGEGNDSLTGGKGNDVFIYSAGNDVITDLGATDTLQIGDGDATYSKETVGKNIVLTIGDGSVTLTGAASLKTLNILGTEIIPTVKFTNSDAAKVTLSSGVLEADATARTKAVKITGNALDNTIAGGTGKDSLYGGDGDDWLEGGKGNDKLYGQSGNDTLWGGIGNDTLNGGAGADVFIYASGTGKDVISGFENDDMLLITGAFTASVNASAKSIVFKVDSTANALTIKNYTATTFNINGLKYKISGSSLVMK